MALHHLSDYYLHGLHVVEEEQWVRIIQLKQDGKRQGVLETHSNMHEHDKLADACTYGTVPTSP